MAVKPKITNYTIDGPGSYRIHSTNGTTSSFPTTYSFDNDISHGEIDNSIKRVQHLQKAEHIKMNHNMTVNGTSQTSSGGSWRDVGSPELHIGHSQRSASATNAKLYALISNYPDRDDGEPIYVPFPSITDCLKEAEKITAEQSPIELPSIASPTDIPKWIAAYVSYIGNQVTKDRSQQMLIAAQLAAEKRQKQIDDQKKYLTEKFGEEMYNLYFRAKVEAGAIYNKPHNPCTITRQDVYQATFADGLAERRNAYTAKIG